MIEECDFHDSALFSSYKGSPLFLQFYKLQICNHIFSENFAVLYDLCNAFNAVKNNFEIEILWTTKLWIFSYPKSSVSF